MLKLITENQLDEWVRGNAQAAQGVIVELVWRLVAASSARPRERRFPLGDSIGQHGPDGELYVDLAFEPFVPEGRSYWEIGTGLNAGDKATSDYSDLVNAIPETVRLESTFVFVTPLSARRDWEYTWKEEAQAAWLEERRKTSEWKGVRVIDGTKLTDWIHHFPSVELWLAQIILRQPKLQIETPEQRWSLIRTIGEPSPLTPHLFLANRDEARAKLKEVFAGNVNRLKLETRFPDQVVDFVCACVAELDEESRADVTGRCLVISEVDVWNAIVALREKHILIADSILDLSSEVGMKLIQSAGRAGHAIIFGGALGGIPDPASVPLPAPRIHQIQDALVKAGYREERARILAQKSGRNLGSLLRCLQNLSLIPEWAEGSAAAELAIAALLGSWNEKSAADRAVVEAMSGKSYGEWIGKVREIALRPGTPITQRDGISKFVARYEGWYALGPRIFDEHLDRLKAAAVSVLQDKDPQFDLPKEERYAAQIHGKVLAHSHVLRTGLAETLALLGSYSRALTSCTHGKVEGTAVLAVREILADADWLRWASLNDVLPLLAEAAPGEFLDAVENALTRDPCPFDEVFAQEGGGFLGRNYMTGLFWALETLAWDADNLSRVVMCLGELAARDPGGQWANRPANSLTAILLPWLPQTCAPAGKRVTAVATLLTELPDIGWKLVLSLLPQSHSVSHGSRRPAWRETIPEDWSKGVPRGEYWQQVARYSELAITAAKTNCQRLVELTSHLESLPEPARERLLEHLGSDAVLTMPETDRLCLWTGLVDLVTKHRKFSDAFWAMGPEQVDRIAALADRLAPTEPVLRHQRLFSERDFELYEEKGNYQAQQKELEERRQRAVKEIDEKGGTQAVLDFANSVQSPWRVGIAYGFVAGANADRIVLPYLLDSEQKSLLHFAGGFVWGRFHSRGWQWVDEVDTSQWEPPEIGQFLSFLPFTSDTWERAARLLRGNESAYWTRTSGNPYEAQTSLELAVDQLIEHDRPYAAVSCIYRMLDDKEPLDNVKAVRALMAALESSENVQSMHVYEIMEIIKALQNDPRTNPDDLCRVEWAYLPLLDRGRDAFPKLLEQRLANNPGFFCEVIRLVFRSRKEERPTEEPQEQAKNIATNAYRLLSEWQTPPGSREDGTYDGDALAAWLDAVKEECAETGHLEVAMTMASHVLIRVPPDPDGLWIHRSAAAALNAKDAGDMRDGFCTALLNARGAYWVDPTGRPERELAEKYRSRADAVDLVGYHRLATALRELAASYEREAERISSREIFGD